MVTTSNAHQPLALKLVTLTAQVLVPIMQRGHRLGHNDLQQRRRTRTAKKTASECQLCVLLIEPRHAEMQEKMASVICCRQTRATRCIAFVV